MAELNMADGDVLTSTDTDLIDQQMVVSCTSSTRPTGIDGRMIFETDTEKVMIYDASAAAWSVVTSSRWVSFTPSWTNVTTTDATQKAGYRYAPGILQVRGTFTFGASTAFTGAVSMALPNSVTANGSVTDDYHPLGQCMSYESGGLGYFGPVLLVGSSAFFYAVNTGATYGSATSVAAAVPFTWGSADSFQYSYTVPI